jgi:hypothetical protein
MSPVFKESEKNSLRFMVAFITNNRENLTFYGANLDRNDLMQSLYSPSESNEPEKISSVRLIGTIPPRLMWILQTLLVKMPRLSYKVLKMTGVHHRAI